MSSPPLAERSNSMTQSGTFMPSSPIKMDWKNSTTMNNNTSGTVTPLELTEETVFGVPTSFKGPEYTTNTPNESKRYIVIMVGLPARGKTFLAKKLCRHLGWLGFKCQVYDIQHMWKTMLPAEAQGDRFTADWYDPTHEAGSRIWREALDRTMDMVCSFMKDNGTVVFLNDDFVTKAQRDAVHDRAVSKCDEVFYIEVVRDSDKNARFEELKIRDAAALGLSSQDAARTEFLRRMEICLREYRQLEESDRFVRVKNGMKLEVSNLQGFIPSKIVSTLMNLNQSRVHFPIFFSRHGESEYNPEDRLGGNPNLTPKGRQDAELLKLFVGEILNDPANSDLEIWTSQLTRTIQTAEPSEKAFNLRCLRWSNLNEIHAGICEHLTYAEVKKAYPLIHEFRNKNKYTFRYPEGESYQDLVARIEPVIVALENANKPIVVVAHQAVLRALLAYFCTTSAEDSVYVEVPHRTVWRVTYSSDGLSHVDTLKLREASPQAHV